MSGNDGSADDDVAISDGLGEKFALAFVESFVLRFAVTAGVLGIFGFDGELDEASA